jgi:hypothetical protein
LRKKYQSQPKPCAVCFVLLRLVTTLIEKLTFDVQASSCLSKIN